MAIKIEHSRQNDDEPKAGRFEGSDKRAPHTILQSWKEIAAELNCGIRTVQRWEKELGMPVRRVGKGPRSPVFAFADELHRWLANAKPKEPDSILLHSLDDFLRARRLAKVKQSCNQCGSPKTSLKGRFWVYGTTMKWTLSLPFCPICDAAAIQDFCGSQIIQ